MWTIQIEMAGCMIPAYDITLTLGVKIAKGYKSRTSAQQASDKVGEAMLRLGMKEVKLWVVKS